MIREVLILTKSSKNKRFCVAGIDTSNGKWVRLVSSDEESGGALSWYNMRYKNGTYCNPLDVAKVPIIKDSPIVYQPENVLIDERGCWKKVREMDKKSVIEKHGVEQPRKIFGNTSHYVLEEAMDVDGPSLVRVVVSKLLVKRNEKGKIKVSFVYNGVSYSNMSVTDPAYYPPFYNRYGEQLNKAMIVVSLPSQPFDDLKFYKFVAKIFPLD